MTEANEIENETAEGRPIENINEAGDDGAVARDWMTTAGGTWNIRALYKSPTKQQQVQQFIEDNYANKEFTIQAIIKAIFDIGKQADEAVNIIAVSKTTVYYAVQELRMGNIYELTDQSDVSESQYISTEGRIIKCIKGGQKTFTVDDIIFNDVSFTDVSETIEKLIDSNELKLVRGVSLTVGKEYIYKLIR